MLYALDLTGMGTFYLRLKCIIKFWTCRRFWDMWWRNGFQNFHSSHRIGRGWNSCHMGTYWQCILPTMVIYIHTFTYLQAIDNDYRYSTSATLETLKEWMTMDKRFIRTSSWRENYTLPTSFRVRILYCPTNCKSWYWCCSGFEWLTRVQKLYRIYSGNSALLVPFWTWWSTGTCWYWWPSPWMLCWWTMCLEQDLVCSSLL